LLAIACNPLVHRWNDQLITRQQAKEAREDALAAMKREPDDAAVHAAVARVLLDSERYDDAISELEKAIELDPEHSQRERIQLRMALAEKQRLGKCRPSARCRDEDDDVRRYPLA
jgi:predicted Zn-dependent protease